MLFVKAQAAVQPKATQAGSSSDSSAAATSNSDDDTDT